MYFHFTLAVLVGYLIQGGRITIIRRCLNFLSSSSQVRGRHRETKFYVKFVKIG